MKSDFFSGGGKKRGEGQERQVSCFGERIYPVAAFCVGGQFPEFALCGVYLVVLWWENLVFKLPLERR